MKTKEELNALKEEVETVSRKLHELTDEELKQVSGGISSGYIYVCSVNARHYQSETDGYCPVCNAPLGIASTGSHR